MPRHLPELANQPAIDTRAPASRQGIQPQEEVRVPRIRRTLHRIAALDQRRHPRRHGAEAKAPALDHQMAEPGVRAQPGQGAAVIGDPRRRIQRAQIAQQPLPLREGARVRWIEQGEAARIVDTPKGEVEGDRRHVGA